MRYRKFGRLNWEVSVLGFGAMRLPLVSNKPEDVNEEEAIKMIRYAIKHGVNYVDTAYPYHDGKSEVVVGKALQDGYGEHIKLATKMPTWLVKSQSDMDKFLEEQLGKLQANHIDFYLLHGLDKERWPKIRNLGVFDWAENKIAKGKIRYLGFSFHDELPLFKEIVDSYDDWSFCQIQYNYMDTKFQAGTEGLRYAASKGLAVVIMEPIAGGMLAVEPPREIQTIWDEAKIKRTLAEWALQWVWNHPEVSVVLSGMSTMDQIIQNIESADHSGAGTLTRKELNIISRVKEKYLEYGFIGCTGCRYCMPCPQGVEIPEIFSLYNQYFKETREGGQGKEISKKYSEVIPAEKGAKRCAQCGQCEDKCPQHLPIREALDKALWVFENK